MQNFLSLYAKIENPTFEMVLFTFLLAFILSSCITLTYYFTTPKTLKLPNFSQALILSSLIATMILQSIGDSVASGLGILGALTIINFRTSFRDPRDIIFMFASLGLGIACGSYVFVIAVTGTVIFCLMAILLKFTPFDLGNHMIWELRIKVIDKESIIIAHDILKQYCIKTNLESIKNETPKDTPLSQERDYVIILKKETQQQELLESLEDKGILIKRINLQSAGQSQQY